ncbi:protein kinase family protein [Holosporaceae bacterium 'Namur']|nr:protein kinase family protein [Holosporaceae bacterium 'Namur']
MTLFISKLISEAPNITEVSLNGILGKIRSELKDINCEIIGISETVNLVADKYLIDINGGKIEGLSTPNADAYSAKDVVSTSSQDYYCLVFKKNIPTRLAEIIALKAVPIPNLIRPLEIGVTAIGEQGERFLCVICEKPDGKSLKELIKEGREFSHQFILKKIVAPLNKMINDLHGIEIVHGNINPSTIFLDEKDEIVVSECISSLNGLCQGDTYETVNRAQCHKWGKGEGDKSVDYYALGMTISSIISKIFFEDIKHINILESKLQNGTFSFLNQHFHFGGTIGDMLKGLVTDDKDIRWGFKDIENILMDGSYSLPAVLEKPALPRPVIFKEKEYFHKAPLAYDLARNWEDAKAFIKQSLLVKWLDISASEQLTIEALESLQEIAKKRFSSYSLFSKEDEHLIKVIIALDPNGPVRYKNLTFYKESLGALLIYSINNEENEITQFIANSLFVDLFSYYEQIAIWFKNKDYATGLKDLKQATGNIRKAGFGFGIERCCYDLNVSLPSQSHVIRGEICYGIKDILTYLDKQSIEIDELLLKKNLLCFVASRIGLAEELRVTKLISFYMLEKDKTFISLMILGIAQEKTGVKELINLSELYAEKIKTILDEVIKGEAIKKDIFAAINKVKSQGNLNLIKQSATDIYYLEQDIKGFTQATARVDFINKELERLKDKYTIEREAKEWGLKIAVKVSYIIVLFSIILAISGGL